MTVSAIPSLTIFGEPEEKVVRQIERCIQDGPAVLCADSHFGYSMPIGGVVAYRDKVSPSGAGYDLSCGNKAVKTDLRAESLNIVEVMDEIKARISFGVGLQNNERADHPVLAEIEASPLPYLRERPPQTGKHERLSLVERAAKQLGTCGGGNHYVDILADNDGLVWVAVHFGSRGFGHGTASGFLALAQGKGFMEHVGEGEMESPPVLIDADSTLGQEYIHAMELANRYAYAGRDWVVDRVLHILGNPAILESVHQNHNLIWRESHFGEDWWVIRKGATPAFPGQRGFVGGSMGDISVVLEGVDSEKSASALYSTVHGAGRVMSRTAAKGKFRKGKRVSAGLIDWDAANRELKERGIVIRGGDADEAPGAYRPLQGVLDHHAGTVRVLHVLRPLGVAMAGYGDGPDWYKD